MPVHSSAPTRIDLAGGTLDIWPLYLYHDGAQTLNAAITLRAACTLSSSADGRLHIVSDDTGASVDASDWSELKGVSTNRLLCRLLHFFRAEALTVRSTSAAPLGAGLAGSSALTVAVSAALARWSGRRLTPEDLLQIAMNIEAQVIDVPTGAQDYRPAMYGGVSAIELGVSGVGRVALDIPPTEIEQRIVLAYTGESRNSGINNWDIMKRHIDGDREVFDLFERLRDIAAALRQALVGGDWDEVGRQLAAEWVCRRQLAPGVSTPAIDRLIGRATAAGARAAKVCGAGGGGCVIFLAEPHTRMRVADAVRQEGAMLLEYRIDTTGLTVTGERDA